MARRQVELPAAVRGLASTRAAIVILATIAAIASARVAEPFLVPLVTGILLSYTLRPFVSLLERTRLPRFFAAMLILVTLLALISATGYALRDEVSDWVAELPVAAHKLRHAVADSARQSPGPITHVNAAAAELDKAAAEATGKSLSPSPTAGVQAQFQEFVAQQSHKALAVLAELVIAVLLAFILLVAGDTFRRKVAKMAGASLARRRVTIELLNEIDNQIQTYMMTLLVANVLIALVTWGALSALGVGNAGLWGAVTGILHVIPYVGTIAAALLIGVDTFVQSGTLGDGIVAAGVVAAIASAFGLGMATWMHGRAARMNPAAVFIGVLFFAWLWGGWGLLLGVPILVVLKSIADRFPDLRPISELIRA
jgi:predicted PurR-regulated permease PerM